MIRTSVTGNPPERTLSVRHIDDLLKQRAELLVLAIDAAHVGGEAPLVIEILPGDVMLRLFGELAQERTQTACESIDSRGPLRGDASATM